MDDPWFRFVLGMFATWRVAHLLAHEDGPWDVVLRIRAALGNGLLGHLLDCFYCLSLWIAAPIALTVARDPVEFGLAWFGLSGAACLLERLAPVPPAVIQQLAIEGDDHELLRTEAGGNGVDGPENRADGTRKTADSAYIVR